ncbi:amidohydrolase family protein [Streptomyces sp. NPDC060022]|uniref:amidohydrolase family protein n=1 Tax=Streptomyces sp. NPDC060022 TaxID=3347039 RepID=UPI0036B89601
MAAERETGPTRVVIEGGHVLSMDPRVGEPLGADVLVEDGRIVEVRRDSGARGDRDAEWTRTAERIDARGCLVLPGFVDTHRHMWQAILRGSGADQTLEQYFDVVLHSLGPRLGPEDLGLGNLLSALGALDAGVTTVQDISNITKVTEEHTDALVHALDDAGIRAVFAYGQGDERDTRRIRDGRMHSDDALVTMALNAEPAGDEDVLREWALARDLDLSLALHVRGGRPLSRLRQLGVLRPGTVYIHGTGLDAGELRILADSGGGLSIAPGIEMTMGHGLPPFAAAAAVGLRPGLSADVEAAAASDLFGQMRTAFQVARFAALHGTDGVGAPLPTTRDVLEFATIDGARVLGMDDRIGSITPGKQADIVVLRADRPGVVPVYDAVGTVVSAMDRADVDTVLVAGRVVKRDGRLLRPDLPALAERANEVRDRLARTGHLRTRTPSSTAARTVRSSSLSR